MLKQLRNKKTAKKVWIILAIVIVPPFILWGSGSLLRGRQEQGIAGKVFGKPVSFLDYKEALDATKTHAIMQFGDKLPEVEKYLNLESQAWARIILLMEAKKRRLKTTDKEVILTIEGYPFFQKNSVFDNRVYLETLRYVFRIQPRAFEEQVRQDVILKKLFEEITKTVAVTEQETREEYRKANEDISLYYIASLGSEFTKDISPGENQLKEYFKTNPLPFKQPLSFNLEYSAISVKEGDDSEAKSKLKKLQLLLRKKLSFGAAAKEAGLTLKETGLFTEDGPIPGIGWLPEVSKEISLAKPGDYLKPAYQEKSFYILRLKERKEPYIPEFEAVKERIKDAFIKEKSLETAKAKAEECLKKLKEAGEANPKAVDFDKIAKELGLKSDTTKPFKFGSYIEGIGASDPFWTRALALPEGSFSDIIATGAGFYIVKLKSKTAVDEKKLSEEKAEFSQRLLSQKKQEYFSKFSSDLNERAKRF